MVPAAFGTIAEDLMVTRQQASYLTTTYTLLGGISPLFMTPYVNLWGRRPAYVLFTVIAVAANIGSAFAQTYATEVLSRAIAGIGSSVALAIGGATVSYKQA
jgi:predicted MFS family arabinose efflux permease